MVLDKAMEKDRLIGLERERKNEQHMFDVAQKKEPAEGHKETGDKVKIVG